MRHTHVKTSILSWFFCIYYSALLVVLVNDLGFATQDESLFTGNAMTYYGRWTYKYEEGARQGAKAVLIVHETAPAAYPWGVVESSNTGSKYTLIDNFIA